MGKIILNDGTEIPNGIISRSGVNQILVSVPGNDIVQAAIMFSDVEKTQKMDYYYAIYKQEFTGYTNIGSLSINEKQNTVSIYLSGEDVSIQSSSTVADIYVPKPIEEESNG